MTPVVVGMPGTWFNGLLVILMFPTGDAFGDGNTKLPVVLSGNPGGVRVTICGDTIKLLAPFVVLVNILCW